jgi:hypothetical protein
MACRVVVEEGVVVAASALLLLVALYKNRIATQQSIGGEWSGEYRVSDYPGRVGMETR